MKTVKKSIILCLCAALLITPMLTSCDLFENVTDMVEDPAQKDCGHEPYEIVARDGVAEIFFDACYSKPFVLEIPETGEDGIPVREIRTGTLDVDSLIPGIMSEEDFLVLQGELEEYYGLTYEEAKEIRNSLDSENPLFENTFYFEYYMAYFIHKDLDDFESDRLREDCLAAYPITEKMDIYVLDHSAHGERAEKIYVWLRNAAPELDDVWYNEAAARAELDYHMAVCDQLTEIRWSSNLEKIGPWVFSESNLTSVTVPGTVKTVTRMAFGNNAALEEITFEEGVTSIDFGVLYGSNHVKTINLPASLEELGQLNPCVLSGGYASEFPTINYAGTMAQWADLFRVWADDPDVVDYGTYVYFDIHCSDGVVQATKTLK